MIKNKRAIYFSESFFWAEPHKNPRGANTSFNIIQNQGFFPPTESYKSCQSSHFGQLCSVKSTKPQLCNTSLLASRCVQSLSLSLSKTEIQIWVFVRLINQVTVCVCVLFWVFRDGKVEESHSSQPVLQGPQEWHQETSQAPPYLHQRGTFSFSLCWVFDSQYFYAKKAYVFYVIKLWVQMDPKFLRNQRYARKHNNKSAEGASEEEQMNGQAKKKESEMEIVFLF